jgi:putative transposase
VTTITLTHKIRLDPTLRQVDYFRRACGVARFTWNWGLAEWKRQYALGKKPSGLKLKKQFNAIKPVEYPWTYEVTKYASQQPFIFLQSAFHRFFSRQANYPRFKKKGVRDSFYIGNDHVRLSGRKIRIPKLGWVRMREALRFSGKVVSATVSRVADEWFVSLNVELDHAPAPCESQAGVGVDLGVKTMATLFDGKSVMEVEGPKPLGRLLKKVRRLQRQLSRRKKRSRNRWKARIRVARLHERIASIRRDRLHKLTTLLTTRYGTIAIEDLDVRGMLRNRRLARSIADVGFHEFRRQLEYKAAMRRNHIERAWRWFPSSKRCSWCCVVNEDLALGDRVFVCGHCGMTLDRDLNAAINLFSTVSSTGIDACGEEGAGSGESSSGTGLDEAGTEPYRDLCRF